MPTLYLSDLDGTLLHPDQRISRFSCESINQLIREGMLFSYATARSIHTASKATAGLDARLPLIVYNGAFIVDPATHQPIHTNLFSAGEAAHILAALLGAGISPIVYCLEDKERMVYNQGRINQGTRDFLETRKGDLRNHPAQSDALLSRAGTFYFTCIDEMEKLVPLYEAFREDFTCMFSRDIYSDTQWLEIIPLAATKANAARHLAKLLHCDRIVAFGDSTNDLPLFDAADTGYAVANAAASLKAKTTEIIASNHEDGVAHWLLNHWKAPRKNAATLFTLLKNRV